MTLAPDARKCETSFMVQGDAGQMYECKAWLEENEGAWESESLQVACGRARAGITLSNYRCRSEIDELTVIAREVYKCLRTVCYEPYRHRDVADPGIASWVHKCLETIRTGRDLVLETA